jgi:23S rRNA pseudouridine1911/1915/1917 synthase
MLHAAELGFVHPVSGEELRFTSPLPADILKVLAALRKAYTPKP